MPAPWLRYPAKTGRQPSTCPSGRPRFSRLEFAEEALTFGLSVHGLTAVACDLCKGAHHVPKTDTP